MIYVVRAFGVKQAQTKFVRMAEARQHAKPALELVADEMMRIFGQVFQSQGRRGGGSWKRDTNEWLLRKQRLGLDPRIGHATLALRESLSIRDAEHQQLEVTNQLVHLSTSLPYAATEERHRPFLKLTLRDRARLRAIIRDYLVESWRLA